MSRRLITLAIAIAITCTGWIRFGAAEVSAGVCGSSSSDALYDGWTCLDDSGWLAPAGTGSSYPTSAIQALWLGSSSPYKATAALRPLEMRYRVFQKNYNATYNATNCYVDVLAEFRWNGIPAGPEVWSGTTLVGEKAFEHIPQDDQTGVVNVGLADMFNTNISISGMGWQFRSPTRWSLTGSNNAGTTEQWAVDSSRQKAVQAGANSYSNYPFTLADNGTTLTGGSTWTFREAHSRLAFPTGISSLYLAEYERKWLATSTWYAKYGKFTTSIWRTGRCSTATGTSGKLSVSLAYTRTTTKNKFSCTERSALTTISAATSLALGLTLAKVPMGWIRGWAVGAIADAAAPYGFTCSDNPPVNGSTTDGLSIQVNTSGV